TIRNPQLPAARPRRLRPLRRPPRHRDHPPRRHPRGRRRLARRQPGDRPSWRVPVVRPGAGARRFPQERRLPAAPGRAVVGRGGSARARAWRRAALHGARGPAAGRDRGPRPTWPADSARLVPGRGAGFRPAGAARAPRAGRERRGISVPDDVPAAPPYRPSRAGQGDDASVHRAVEPRVADPPRFAALHAASARHPGVGALPRRRTVPVLRRAGGRETHLLRHVRGASGRDPAGQGNAARSARAASAGSLAVHTAPITATPAAPTRASAAALATVMPPIAITGVPAGASRASRAKPSAPSGGPASGLFPVAKHGPTLQ